MHIAPARAAEIRRATRVTALIFVLASAIILAGAPSAHAADLVTIPDGAGVPMLALALDVPQLLNLFIAVVFPILVGIVTKRVTSGFKKATLLATISLASGLVSQLLTAILAGIPFDIIGALLTGLAAWLIAIATYVGYWKPTGIAANVQESIGVGASGPRVDGAHND